LHHGLGNGCERFQRFNNKAFAITLSELSAMALPANTGLR
jgi:hypothetical protein